jgi:hypothetical protein
MKKGDKKKQTKALAKRTERRTAQRTARATSGNPERSIIQAASHYPIEGCWVQAGWREAGLAVVVIARRQPDGLLLFGDYLVDHYCLGVKDCYTRINIPRTVFYEQALPTILRAGGPQEIAPALAHELIYGSIEYAAGYGFRPHRDFAKAQQVLDPPDAHPRSGFAFGKDGKPFFVSGLHDNVNAVMEQLLRTAGPGNFDYLTEIDPALGERLFTAEDQEPDA